MLQTVLVSVTMDGEALEMIEGFQMLGEAGSGRRNERGGIIADWKGWLDLKLPRRYSERFQLWSDKKPEALTFSTKQQTFRYEDFKVRSPSNEGDVVRVVVYYGRLP